LDSEFFIIQKLELFNLAATVSVSWWVAIVALESTLVAAMFLKGDEISSKFWYVAISILGFAFISLSIRQAFTIETYYRDLNFEISNLLPPGGEIGANFSTEFIFAIATINSGKYALMAILLCFGIACLLRSPWLRREE
jgi:hypothetical protein